MPTLWRYTSRSLLAYQTLVAIAVVGFGAWLTIGAINCPASCGLGGLGLLVLGVTWLVGGLLATAMLCALIVIGYRWRSRGALVVTIAGEALLLLPEIRFHDLMQPFGLPQIGLYLLAAAMAANGLVIVLSLTTLLVPIDVGRHTGLAVGALTVIPFLVAGVAPAVTAYSSAQIGQDGLPVGPVTADFIQRRAASLPLRYPGTTVVDSRASAEDKVFNRYQMASASLVLKVDGLKAAEQAWYESSLASNGWTAIQCRPGGCPDDFMTVFRRGSRECISLLITNDGVGSININYQIAPSGWPFTGDPTTDHRRCTDQY